ncbi:MAG: DUF1350 family protein [Leptolyngbyaceae cyanobacterium MAG.088]|nr:DUF1350 family protein [Leptolyngbyaceae cyanobacterium MAG.088]
MVSSLPSKAAPCQFLPCSHSWVALHPQPKGVIQFVGSMLFGVVPTFSYRYFLESLFKAGYTVVALPFRFTLHHWSIAIELLDEHYMLRTAMVEMAMAKGYDSAVYLDSANYAWIGHGLGCKYIMLLELLSTSDDALAGYFQDLEQDASEQLSVIQQGLACLSDRLKLVENYLQRLTSMTIDYGQPSIMHQASLLLAPAIKDPIFVKLLRLSGSKRLTVSPSMVQTHQLVEYSRLFRLTGLIQFARDRETANTCQQLMQEQPHIRRRLLKGNHLEPVGFQVGQFVMDFNPLDKFIQPLSCRDLEFKTLALLNRLRQVPPSSHQTRYAVPSSSERLAA